MCQLLTKEFIGSGTMISDCSYLEGMTIRGCSPDLALESCRSIASVLFSKVGLWRQKSLLIQYSSRCSGNYLLKSYLKSITVLSVFYNYLCIQWLLEILSSKMQVSENFNSSIKDSSFISGIFNLTK